MQDLLDWRAQTFVSICSPHASCKSSSCIGSGLENCPLLSAGISWDTFCKSAKLLTSHFHAGKWKGGKNILHDIMGFSIHKFKEHGKQVHVERTDGTLPEPQPRFSAAVAQWWEKGQAVSLYQPYQSGCSEYQFSPLLSDYTLRRRGKSTCSLECKKRNGFAAQPHIFEPWFCWYQQQSADSSSLLLLPWSYEKTKKSLLWWAKIKLSFKDTTIFAPGSEDPLKDTTNGHTNDMFMLQGMVIILTIDWEWCGSVHWSGTCSYRKAQKGGGCMLWLSFKFSGAMWHY